MPAITIQLRNHGGTPQRTVSAEARWFTPPKILVIKNGAGAVTHNNYYLRVSADNIYNPLVFDEQRVGVDIYFLPDEEPPDAA